MNNLNLMREAGALAGYTIDGLTGQDPINKTRAQRRINTIKADIISRFGGKWSPNYREGWVAIVTPYITGTVTFTNGSRTVTGSGTLWTSIVSPAGQKIKGADNAYYKVSNVGNDTTLTLSQPYQGTTLSGQSYQIWQDEYRLFPEVQTIGGFIDYQLPARMTETWAANMKESYPFQTSQQEPTIYTLRRKEPLTSSYAVGTLSGTQNTNILTGSGTSWLANIEPGYHVTIGSVTYNVRSVDSDTQLTLYQLISTAIIAGSIYTAIGKNCPVVSFLAPTTQRIVHYWYYAKDYPFVNDGDEDWIAEMYPRVILDGVMYFDYLDKNDVPRGLNSRTVFENSIKDMHTALEQAYTGIRTLGIYVPPEARD